MSDQPSADDIPERKPPQAGVGPGTPLPRLSWQALIARLYQDRSAAVGSSQGGEAASVGGSTADADEAAWVEFTARVRRLAALSLRWHPDLAPDDLDDLAQDVVIQFLNLTQLERLHVARSPASYVVVVLRNRALNFARGRRRSARSLDAFRHELFASSTESSSPPSMSKDDTGSPFGSVVIDLRRALETLPAEDQELLRERFWRSRPIAEIASARGTSYSATAVRIFRILRTLRERLRI